VQAPVRFIIGTRECVVGAAGGGAECEFTVRVVRHEFFAAVLCYGNLGLGESYMRGDFALERGRLDDFLTMLLRSRVDETIRRTFRLAVKAGAIQVRNMFRSRGEAVQIAYDIGTDLYEAFLDPTLTYTCGYAQTPDDSIETLQRNKLQRICQKLRIGPGDRILDIGCGFGGLLMFAAEQHGACGVGITISPAQHERATDEIRRRGLDGRIRVELTDYRDHRLAHGSYDKVVAVGLLEHLPPSEHPRFFRTVAAGLKPGGLGLVHSVGTSQPRSRHDPFTQKYIFPKSHQVHLSALVAAMERTGLAVLDVENMVRHYAYTTRRWLERFQDNVGTLDRNRYDETFHRMWEYYLSSGVAAARASDGALYQVLFHNDRAAPIPLVRV